MTLDELRDWHAKRVGWTKVPAHPSLTGWGEEWWKYTISESHGGRTWGKDPFPATLDGAAAAMPEGWQLRRLGGTENGWEACAMRDAGNIVSVCDQPTEIHARYLLAKLAHDKEAERDSM